MVNNKNELERFIIANRLLVKMRWFYLGAMLLTGILNRISGVAAVNMSTQGLGILLLTALATNSFYQYYFWKAKRRSPEGIKIVSFLQILADIVILIFTIFLAGGIISVSFLYLTFAIIASGFFYQRRGVLFTATLASVLYAGLLWGQFLEVIPYIPRYNDLFEINLSHSFWPVLINTFTISASFYMIGLFVGMYSGSIRKKEDEIIRERDKGEAIVSNLVDGLIYFNESGKIDTVNHQAERLLDFRARNVLGKSLVELNSKKLTLLKQVLIQEGGRRDQEIIPDSKPDITLKVRTFDIRDASRKFIGTCTLVRDVSREKFVDNMKSEFITIAGHQLRTPLSAIKGALHLLKIGDYGKVSQEQSRVLVQCYEYNEKLITLVNDFLNVSSIEQGRYEYQFEKIDIQNFLHEIIESFSSDAVRSLISLKLKIKANPSKVILDSYKVKLALGGIINNALCYTPKRGKVDVICSFTGRETVLIEITDTGIGIPLDQQEKVFTKFFRAPNALRVKTEGNGLDLFVAKNIVETHGGKIWFKSEEGVGSRFYIELPLKAKRQT